MTHESQRIFSQRRSDGDAKEIEGVKKIHSDRSRRPGPKAKQDTSVTFGDRFGRLTAVSPVPHVKGVASKWVFRCDCGWQGPKLTYKTVVRPGTCGRRCPFQLVDYGRNPNGCGSRTTKGYIAVRVGDSKVLEHRLVWEREHGGIPRGMQIHHKDGNKANNALSNLALVTASEHAKLHSGLTFSDGRWKKPCTQCGEVKPESEYYARFGRIRGRCKVCIRKIMERYRRRLGAKPRANLKKACGGGIVVSKEEKK